MNHSTDLPRPENQLANLSKTNSGAKNRHFQGSTFFQTFSAPGTVTIPHLRRPFKGPPDGSKAPRPGAGALGAGPSAPGTFAAAASRAQASQPRTCSSVATMAGAERAKILHGGKPGS